MPVLSIIQLVPSIKKKNKPKTTKQTNKNQKTKTQKTKTKKPYKKISITVERLQIEI